MNDGELVEQAVILEVARGNAEVDEGRETVDDGGGGRARLARGSARLARGSVGLARGSVIDLRAAIDALGHGEAFDASEVALDDASEPALDADAIDALGHGEALDDASEPALDAASEQALDAGELALDARELALDDASEQALDASERNASEPALDAGALDGHAELDAPGVSRKVRKRTKRDRPRSKTIAMKRVNRAELQLGAMMYPPVEGIDRPRTRAECSQEARPCPWVSCKHHLYLDINPETGSIKINFPDLEPWEMKHTCSLDVADAGALTLEEIGFITNLTRERIRQVEVRGLLKLKGRRELR